MVNIPLLGGLFHVVCRGVSSCRRSTLRCWPSWLVWPSASPLLAAPCSAPPHPTTSPLSWEHAWVRLAVSHVNLYRMLQIAPSYQVKFSLETMLLATRTACF